MARHDNDTDTEKGAPRSGSALSYLITEQDIHAFVDGQLAGERHGAVARFLSERSMTAREAAVHLRSTFDLRAVKDEIYADVELKAEIDRLMATRGANAKADAGQDEEPAKRASA